MGGEVGVPHLVGITTHPRHEIPVLEVAVEAGDVLPPLPDHGTIHRGIRIDHLGRDEDHQFALVVLELGIPEKGTEDGDVPEPGQLVDAVSTRGVDQARQDDGLAGVDVDHRVRLAGQEGRIALNGERRIDLTDGGVDRRQDCLWVSRVGETHSTA